MPRPHGEHHSRLLRTRRTRAVPREVIRAGSAPAPMLGTHPGADRGRKHPDRVLRNIALVVGALETMFLSAFALDAFAPGVPLIDQLVGFVIHLIPSLVLAMLIAVAWRVPVAGGLALILVSTAPFIGLSNPLWVNLILSLPVAATGCLFVASAVLRRPEVRRTS
jgi:hypothetical protein